MCSNYEPITANDRLLATYGVEAPHADFKVEAWPLGEAPFIRLSEEGKRICESGQFGLLPFFAKELAFGRKTYNARSETVHQLASFKHAWAGSQRCIVPAECIFEPNWETGKAVRWAIQHPGRPPMHIAGIYRRWRAPDGSELNSFAMLTVNADGHPVMQRFHKPGDEKRMVLILTDEQLDEWLTCSPAEAAGFFKQYMGPLEAFAAPLPPRTRKVAED